MVSSKDRATVWFAIDAEQLRHITEVMNMDTDREETIAEYAAMLKAKMLHVSTLSAEQRAVLREQWRTLVEEVKSATGEDPGGPKAQNLVDRWLSLLQAQTGADPTKITVRGSQSIPFRATPELRDALWARRADWLPAGSGLNTAAPTDTAEAMAQLRERAVPFGDSDVLEFIQRALAARQ